MTEVRRISAFAARFHVGELISQRSDTFRGERLRDGKHERVVHSRACAVRESKTRGGTAGSHPNPRNGMVAIDVDLYLL